MFTALILFTITAEPPKNFSIEAKKELKKLEGKWRMVKMVDANKESELKDGEGPELYFVFKGTELTLTSGEKEKTETLHIAALDTTTDPQCIDLVERRPGKPDRTLEGVYNIDGDKLQLAISIPKEGKNRPTSFEKPGERSIVWTFKRIKE